MSTVRHAEGDPATGFFASARKGYDRAAVDRFVEDTQSQIAGLSREVESLAAQNRAMAAKQAMTTDYSSLGGRAQEILRIAEEQARETTQRATTAADDLVAGAERDADRMRDDTVHELAGLREHRLAELDVLRRRTEDDSTLAVERAHASAQQLLAAARLEAEAVRTEAQARAHDLVQAAVYEAEQQRAAAQREAAAVAADVAAHRETTYAELQRAQEEAAAHVEAMLAEATRQQTTTAAHLAAETEQAVALRAEALADAERVRTTADADAADAVARAQQQAATIDERARQEYAWRRRQMRQEQALLDQRRSAILGQLTSLSALAAETAGNLPEVPEILFSDFESVSSGSTDARTDARTAAPTSADERADDRGHDQADEHQDEDATTVRYLDSRSA
ncbi:DivIVA domain-containing protein [Microlunatus antarcticus]|uniref:Cell division septum initiation protein DivIVA n=1 Tax=Microlunatus antarcticus TaxID=53388 RepID=A0A7W5JW92_9ACTN|nr:DivIVA domain-containing protein [Microlunatus antarcticus]MBB3327423.1 cell division septum initiation protein DivIVA [Microlunatus antarcticus]